MVNTNWTPRKTPVEYIQELQDTTNIVCNEDGVVIYIYADDGEPIYTTQWTPRA